MIKRPKGPAVRQGPKAKAQLLSPQPGLGLPWKCWNRSRLVIGGVSEVEGSTGSSL